MLYCATHWRALRPRWIEPRAPDAEEIRHPPVQSWTLPPRGRGVAPVPGGQSFPGRGSDLRVLPSTATTFRLSRVFQSVYRRNTGMIQRCQHTRFPLESGRPVIVVTQGFRKKFDRHAAAKFRVGGLIHLTHPACPQVAGDLVVCELGSNHDISKVRRSGGCSLSNTQQLIQVFAAGP